MLMRFDPFRELDRVAGELAGRGPRVLAMDAYRSQDHVTVHFDLPGIDPDAVDVTVDGNQLNVEAQRTWEPAGEDKVIAAERPQGTFRRSIFLGEGLDLERVEADYDRGVLTLNIPVAEAAKPRKVSVAGKRQPALSS